MLVGNVLVKARNCAGNRGVIHFGQDGGGPHDGTIYLAHNTIVTPFISPVVTLSDPKAKAQFFNNLIWDGGAKQGGQRLIETSRGADDRVHGSCNWLSAGFGGKGLDKLPLERTYLAKPGHTPPFADGVRGDYRLTRTDASIVNAGATLPADLRSLIGLKLRQYRSPCAQDDRPDDGTPDIGAYEYPSRP